MIGQKKENYLYSFKKKEFKHIIFSITLIIISIALSLLLFSNNQLVGKSVEQYPGPKQTYHVDSSYTRSISNGSKDQPWKTISEAAAFPLQPGDLVIVHPGTYRETIKLKLKGTSDAPITFLAENEVIIKGSDLIQGWEQKKGCIYSHPNRIYKEPYPVTNNAADAMLTLSKNGKDFLEDYRKLNNWEEQEQFLRKEFPEVLYSLMRNQVFMGEKQLKEVVSYEALNPGTFYINPLTKELFVCLPDQSNPTDHTIEGSTRDGLIHFDPDSSFIVFKGFKLRHSSSPLVGGTSFPGTENAIQVEGISHTFENNEIKDINGIGLNLLGKALKYYGPPEYAIDLDTSVGHHLIKGNTIEHSGFLGIAGNEISGIKLYDNTVRFNSFRSRFLKPGWAGGGIKAVSSQDWDINGLKSYYNFYHGLWFDVNCYGNKIRNSAFYGNDAAIRLEYCNTKTPEEGNLITNNIIYSNKEGINYNLNGYLNLSNNLIAFNDMGIVSSGAASSLDKTNSVTRNLITDNAFYGVVNNVFSFDTLFDNNLYYYEPQPIDALNGINLKENNPYLTRQKAVLAEINNLNLSAEEKLVLTNQREYYHPGSSKWWNPFLGIRFADNFRILSDWQKVADYYLKEFQPKAGAAAAYSGEAQDLFFANYLGTKTDFNISPNNWVIELLLDQNSIFTDPKYLDPINANFCLNPGSIASIEKIGPEMLSDCPICSNGEIKLGKECAETEFMINTATSEEQELLKRILNVIDSDQTPQQKKIEIAVLLKEYYLK